MYLENALSGLTPFQFFSPSSSGGCGILGILIFQYFGSFVDFLRVDTGGVYFEFNHIALLILSRPL